MLRKSSWLRKWNGTVVFADSNVWMAFALSGNKFHAAVSAWMQHGRRNGLVCFCRSTQQSFLRLLTTESVLAPFGLPALPNAAAWSVYERLLADGRIGWLDEPSGLESQWKKYCSTERPSPKLWMDAYLAAFALAGDTSSLRPTMHSANSSS